MLVCSLFSRSCHTYLSVNAMLYFCPGVCECSRCWHVICHVYKNIQIFHADSFCNALLSFSALRGFPLPALSHTLYFIFTCGVRFEPQQRHMHRSVFFLFSIRVNITWSIWLAPVVNLAARSDRGFWKCSQLWIQLALYGTTEITEFLSGQQEEPQSIVE